MRPHRGRAGFCAARWLMASPAGALCKVVVVLVLVIAVAGQQATTSGNVATSKTPLRTAFPPPYSRRAFPPPPPPAVATPSTGGGSGAKPVSTSQTVDPTAKLKEAASILRQQLAVSDTSGLATFARTALTPQAADAIYDQLPKREFSYQAAMMAPGNVEQRMGIASVAKPSSGAFNAADALPAASIPPADTATIMGPVSDGEEEEYNYSTGLDAVAQMLRTNTSSELADLVKGMDNLGWLVRSYDIAGDPLLRIRINQDMERLVQSAVAESISSLANIPSNQVLLFASANVTQVLSVRGVDWAAGAGQAATAAFEKALALVGGDFDADYVDVAVGAAAAAAAAPPNSSSSNSSAVGRKLQQAAAAAAPPAAGAPQTVRVTYYGMAPNNASSLLTELESACLTGLTPGQPLAGQCQAALVEQLRAAGVLTDAAGFQATPVSRPQVSLDVSIAVGLNNTQAASGAGQLSATFLNSTALGDILKDFNLSARPTEWIDTFLGPNRTAPFWRIPGLLSSPSPSPPTKPGPGRSPTPSDVEDVPAGPPSTRDKGFYAAIAVAITVATAALIGLIVVIIKRRRETSGAAAQREQKAGGVELTNGGAGGGAGQQRRTRRARPRVYNAKYLPGHGLPTVHVDAPAPGDSHGAGSSGASSSNGASSSSSAAAAAAAAAGTMPGSIAGAGSAHVEVDLPPPVALVRHDSVMSAVRVEMDDMGSVAGSRSGSSEGGSSQGSEAGSLPSTPSAPGSRAQPRGRSSASSSRSALHPHGHVEAGHTGSSSSSRRPRTRSTEGEGPSSQGAAAAGMGHMTHVLLPPVGAWQYHRWPGPMVPLTPDGAVLSPAAAAGADGQVPLWGPGPHMAALMGHAAQQQQQQQQMAGLMSYWGSCAADSSDLELISQRLAQAPHASAEGGEGVHLGARRSASAGQPLPLGQLQQQQQGLVVGNLIARASSLVLERKASCNQLAAAAPLAAVGQPSSVVSSSTAVAAGQRQVRGSSSSSSSSSSSGGGGGGGISHPCEQPHSPPPVHFAPSAAVAALPTPGTPPVTPVTPMAAAFALMSQQLGGSSSSSRGAGGGPPLEEVQPLGASCWHAGGHTSGFKLDPAEAPAAVASGAAGTASSSKPPAPAYVSPFAAMAAGFDDAQEEE